MGGEEERCSPRPKGEGRVAKGEGRLSEREGAAAGCGTHEASVVFPRKRERPARKEWRTGRVRRGRPVQRLDEMIRCNGTPRIDRAEPWTKPTPSPRRAFVIAEPAPDDGRARRRSTSEKRLDGSTGDAPLDGSVGLNSGLRPRPMKREDACHSKASPRRQPRRAGKKVGERKE